MVGSGSELERRRGFPESGHRLFLASDDLLPDFKVNWQAVQSEEPFQFGPFTIEFVVSDHDTIGAASIFITGPDLKVINSGDFRLTEPTTQKSLAKVKFLCKTGIHYKNDYTPSDKGL